MSHAIKSAAQYHDAAEALFNTPFQFIVVPGLHDSGPAHWQSAWHDRFPGWLRITQIDWNRPDIDSWLAAIEKALALCRQPAILVAHSFGALASTLIAARHPDTIAGALLVAPADPAKFGLADVLPQSMLPMPTTLIGSRNDPWLRYEWAATWAQRWGSELVDLGTAGHVNADSGYGPWPEGLVLLATLHARAERSVPGRPRPFALTT